MNEEIDPHDEGRGHMPGDASTIEDIVKMGLGTSIQIPQEFYQMVNGKTFDLVSQSAHVFSGICFGFFPAHFGLSLRIIVPFWLVVFAVKEFWYDYKYENAAVRGSSVKDFAFCVLGLVLGAGPAAAHTNAQATCATWRNPTPPSSQASASASSPQKKSPPAKPRNGSQNSCSSTLSTS